MSFREKASGSIEAGVAQGTRLRLLDQLTSGSFDRYGSDRLIVALFSNDEPMSIICEHLRAV